MSSTVRESNRSLVDKELPSHAKGKANDEQLIKNLDNVLLREERREEAKKPLFLTRYE